MNGTKSSKIMIVEDSNELQDKIKLKLSKNGFDVVNVVASGNDAIRRALCSCPDLILMDIMLEGKMDGIETAKKINKKIDVPIIFLTAYSDEDFIKRAEKLAPYGYILKPFRERDLIISIKMAIAKHKEELKKHEKIKDEFYHIFSTKTIPICAKCKCIRDVEGHWHQVEDYFRLTSNISFSHSICPICFEDLYPEYAQNK